MTKFQCGGKIMKWLNFSATILSAREVGILNYISVQFYNALSFRVNKTFHFAC